MTVLFDFSGAELFLAYLAQKKSVQAVLTHPAYQAVCRHAQLFGSGITEADLELAAAGRPSPFYGLEGVSHNLAGIYALLSTLRQQADTWSGIIETALARIAPNQAFNVLLYPIIGYDMGIGLDGKACLNCNFTGYLNDPSEFLFYAIHECVHVLYERSHLVPALNCIITPQDWRSYFNLWLQNEGFAVYAPLALRTQLNALSERDYRVLSSPHRLKEHQARFRQAIQRLKAQPGLSQDEYMELCFGPERFTYRIGCALIQAIEAIGGLPAVQAAFRLDGDEFWARFHPLVDESEDLPWGTSCSVTIL